MPGECGISDLFSDNSPSLYLSLPCGQGNCEVQGPELRNTAHRACTGGATDTELYTVR